MKTKTNRNSVRTHLAIALFLSLFFIPAAQAQYKLPPAPVEVKYLGVVNTQPVFGVEFANPDEDEYMITLRDGASDIVYTEKFRDKKFSKKFQFSGGELGNVTVTLSSKKYRQAQVFQINKSTRIVEDVVVTKLR